MIRCTGEIIFLRCTVEIRQGKVITAFEQEAASFLGSKFYTTATSNTIVKLILNLNSVQGFLCIR